MQCWYDTTKEFGEAGYPIESNDPDPIPQGEGRVFEDFSLLASDQKIHRIRDTYHNLDSSIRHLLPWDDKLKW